MTGIRASRGARQAKDALDAAQEGGRISAWEEVEEDGAVKYAIRDNQGRFGGPITALEVVDLLGVSPADRTAQPRPEPMIPVSKWILHFKSDHPYGDGMPRRRSDLTPEQQVEFDAVMLAREPLFENARRLLAGEPLKDPDAESVDKFELSDDLTPAEHEEC